MVSYKPLWRYCLEHDISKQQCREMCGISQNTWTKLNKGEEVSMAILNKICQALNLSYGDIIEYIPADENTCEEVN